MWFSHHVLDHFWRHSGGQNGAFWELFGSKSNLFTKVPTLSKHCACHVDSRFGPLQNVQNRAQHRVFWRCGARSCSGASFCRFWSSFWEPFGTKMAQKGDPKKDRFLGRIKKREVPILGSARRNVQGARGGFRRGIRSEPSPSNDKKKALGKEPKEEGELREASVRI